MANVESRRWLIAGVLFIFISVDIGYFCLYVFDLSLIYATAAALAGAGLVTFLLFGNDAKNNA